MRKDAVQAITVIKALGFTDEHLDSQGHLRLRYPGKDAEVTLSLTPSDIHAPGRAIRKAHLLLGLAPPQSAAKRRPATVRSAKTSRIQERTRGQRTAQARKAAAAQEHRETREAAERRLRVLKQQIAVEMVILRSCRTRAGRAAIEARMRPLAEEQRQLLSTMTGTANAGRPGLARARP